MCRSSALPSKRRLLAIAAVIAIVVWRARSCGVAPTPVPPASSTSAPVETEVELSGCAAVLARGVCELPADGVVRVWTGGPAGWVTFSTESGPLEETIVAELPSGTLHRIVLVAGTRELRVASRAGSTRALHLSSKSAPAWVDRARSLRQSGDIDGAASLVALQEASPNDVDRAFALGLRARLLLSAGDTQASFPRFREAARLHQQLGRVSDAADDRFALAFALNQRSHRYAEARDVLDDVHRSSLEYADGRAREAYYRGTLATETGDVRGALQHLAEASEHARKLGLAQLERNARNAYALQLELVGRAPEALELLAALERQVETAADATACESAEIAINMGFGALLVNEQRSAGRSADELPLVDAVGPLERALVLCTERCKDRYLRTASLGNLAFAALQKGDLPGARRRLAEARGGLNQARAVEVLFWHEVDGRIALAAHEDARAVAAFEEESRRAKEIASYEAEWRAHVGKGEAFERLARNAEALAEYRAAEEIVTGASVLVPLGEGRGSFVGDRGRSATLAVDLLIRLGHADEALAVVRAARVRVVATLAQRARVEGLDGAARSRWERSLGAYRNARGVLEEEALGDWKLPRAEAARARGAREAHEVKVRAAFEEAFVALDDAKGARRFARQAKLDAVPTDAATLAYHPVRRGWVGLLADGSGVTSFAIPELAAAGDSKSTSERLLSPASARLDHARRLRVLPFGVLRAVDFHALPYAGRPLVASLAVEYPLDLPASPEPPRHGASALVVADPTLDLRGAHAETEQVVRALRESGWRVDVLDGPQATSAALLPLLATATLFHYAGHGVFAGREGWQSALPLASGGHLTIGDVLASGAAPARVVLSGCETARTAADSPIESLGLAQAFVVSGADFVVAPVRPVDDALAEQVSRALYGQLAQVGPVDAAEALRDVQQRLASEQPSADWSAFRVVCR